MQIQFWGAARTVTGSMHLLTINGQRLLLDCGLFQGKRSIANERNSQSALRRQIDRCVCALARPHGSRGHAADADQVRLRWVDLLHLGLARFIVGHAA